MSLTIFLSGPGGFESQARKALTEAGLCVHKTTADHLLPNMADGSADPTQSFTSCEGDHPDQAVPAVEPLGWVLRAHYETPKVSPVPAAVDTETEKYIREMVRQELAILGSAK